MNNLNKQIEELHSAYCRETGVKLKYFTGIHYYRWEQFIVVNEWTMADLLLVIRYIKRLIKTGQRRVESFKLTLLLDQERFAEDLSMAQAESRKPKIDYGKQQVLRSAGRDQQVVKDTSKTPSEIMQEHTKMAELLAAWRNEKLKHGE